jgi:hypothetical protein
LREAVIYYRDHASHGIARDFNGGHGSRQATSAVSAQGVLAEHSAKRFPLHDYPYSVVYRVEPREIILIAIAHQSRRPGYWAGRR